jgi:hypothetical protein
MNANHLVRDANAELLLKCQKPDQQMLLRDSKLRHVKFRHHVVNVQHDPGPEELRDKSTSTSKSGMV